MVEQRHHGYHDALAAAGIATDAELERFDGVWDAGEAAAMVDACSRLSTPRPRSCAAMTCSRSGPSARPGPAACASEEIAVTGFNDLAFAEFVEPSITTVHVPGYEMGRAAAQLLIDELRGGGVWSRLVGAVELRRLLG